MTFLVYCIVSLFNCVIVLSPCQHTGLAKKPGPLCFTACNFRNIDEICIELGTSQRHFILNIKS